MGSEQPNSGLLKNTVMLYVLTGSNYVLGFITIPYLTRVLGAESYGIVGFGQAVATYIQLAIDFGFLLSATATIANSDRERKLVSTVMSSVLQAKILICLICAIAVFTICCFVPQFRNEPVLIGLFFVYATVNSFMPDFVYRGLEMMSAITYRAVTVKAFFVICIFLFVHGPQDYLLVPLFYLIGALAAISVVYAHLAKSLGIRYLRVGMSDTLRVLKVSAGYFASRIASTFYSTMNYVIIGVFYPTSVELGCYTATDKAVGAGKSASSPIADSLYPYMLRTKNYKLLINISVIGTAILCAASAVVFVNADFICVLLFGEEYVKAAPLLRILLPTIPLAFVSYLYGFPALTPIGKADYANLSVIIAAGLQVCLLAMSWAMGDLTVITICICTFITEAFVALSRLLVFVRTYRKMKRENVGRGA